jgi:hypothetical protein
MIHTHWFSIAYQFSQMVVKHGVLRWASGCESWWALMCQWLWIMVYYAVSVVVNHGVLCWASGCESCCSMLCQWLWSLVCYAEPVSGCESWLGMLSQWFTMIHNHCLSISHDDSQPLTQYITTWCTTTDSAWYTMIHSHWHCWTHHDSLMVWYTEPVVLNHGVLCWASEWLWIMVWYADQVVINYGFLCWTSEWLWIMMLNIAHHVSKPLTQYSTAWFTTTCSA